MGSLNLTEKIEELLKGNEFKLDDSFHIRSPSGFENFPAYTSSLNIEGMVIDYICFKGKEDLKEHGLEPTIKDDVYLVYLPKFKKFVAFVESEHREYGTRIEDDDIGATTGYERYCTSLETKSSGPYEVPEFMLDRLKKKYRLLEKKLKPIKKVREILKGKVN